MFVTDIEIAQYQYCPVKARHQANVTVSLPNQIVTLFCQVDLAPDVAQSARSTALKDDALRQLRRMPELRSGQAALQFATGFDHLAHAHVG